MHLDEVEFTIFDTETTGLDPQLGDRIIEIAALRFKGDEKISSFQSLINPLRDLPLSAQRINNISPEMLENAPTIDKIMPSFLEFIKGSYLCAYNASFDFSFLENELKLIGLPSISDKMIVDLLKMSKELLPGLPRYALWFVAESLGIKASELHRAFRDVEVSFEIFKKLKRIFFERGLFDLDSFLNLFCLEGSFLNNLNLQKISKIQEAIDLKAKIKIKYFSHKDAEVSEREIIPSQIKEEKYLVGFCLLRKEERTFNIERILNLEILNGF